MGCARTRAIATSGWSVAAVARPGIFVGGRVAEVISVQPYPAVPEVTIVRVRVPDRVAPGSDVGVRMVYQGRFSNEVTVSVR